MSLVKLIGYKKEIIERGTILRCAGKYPYEEVVEFLVCKTYEENCGCSLIVSTGYKAGLTMVTLPPESNPKNGIEGIRTGWLVENWKKWGYIDCPIDQVYVYERAAPSTLLFTKIDVRWFNYSIRPLLPEFAFHHHYFESDDRSEGVHRVEIEGNKKGSKVMFYDSGALCVFVYDYKTGKELLNIHVDPDQDEEKYDILKKLPKLLIEE